MELPKGGPPRHTQLNTRLECVAGGVALACRVLHCRPEPDVRPKVDAQGAEFEVIWRCAFLWS